jgi:hypothetical protein
MAQQWLDSFNTAWASLEPDNSTPSSALVMSIDTDMFRFGADQSSGRISATTEAADHRLRHTFPAVDLTTYDELRLSILSDLAANGGAAPFYLELRLASAAMSFEDTANTWRRYLPISEANQWETARFTLYDLPDAVRSAVTMMQVRCVAVPRGFTIYLDDPIAVRQEMIGDAEQALVEYLNVHVRIDDAPVPVYITHSGTTASEEPYLHVTLYGIRYVQDIPVQQRVDFVDAGYSLLPPAVGYELYYEIDCRAPERSTSVRLFESVLAACVPRRQLRINNVLHRLEQINIDLHDTFQRAEHLLVRFKISTQQEVGAPQRVQVPYHEIAVGVGYQ